MKGMAVFLGLLLIFSSVNALPITLNADAVPACRAQAGCSMDVLYSTITGLSAVGLGGGNFIITSTQNAIVTIPANKQLAQLGVDGNAIINVGENAKLVVDTAVSVATKASLFVYGQLEVGAASVDKTTTSTFSGVFSLGASAKAIFDNGIQLLVSSATSLGAGATLQIGNTASVAQGTITATTDAVVAVVATTLTLAGTVVSTGQSYVSAANATIQITASTTIGAVLVLKDNAQVQAQAAAAAVAGLIVTGASTTIEVAADAVFNVKGEATVTANAALTTVRKIIYEYRLIVDGNVTFTRANGTAAPEINGGITVSLGGHVSVGVNTGILARVASTIQGTLILFAGASYQAVTAVHVIADLVVAASGVLIIAVQGSVVEIQKYTVVLGGAFQTAGDVRYVINQ